MTLQTLFVTGDTAPDLTGTCTSGTSAANITGATLELHLTRPDKTVITRRGHRRRCGRHLAVHVADRRACRRDLGGRVAGHVQRWRGADVPRRPARLLLGP